MKTVAAVLEKLDAPLMIEELSVPELKPGQVLVKVLFSGLCHSQLNEMRGLKGKDKFLPHTLGHEGSGIVEAVGKGVTKVKPGDPVVLTWIKAAGRDVPATKYLRLNGGCVNSGAISTFLTRAVISENRVVKISKEMPLDLAALLGCAIATGMGSVKNIAQPKKGESLAVYGIGGVGLAAVHAAAILGANPVIAIDVSAEKLKKAAAFGATHLIDAGRADVVKTIMELTGGRGVDHAIECAGITESMENAFRCVRNNGGRAVIAGNLPKDGKITIDPFMLICGKRIAGSWGGATDPEKDIPEYVKMYLDGKLQLAMMIARRFKLSEINAGFDMLESGDAGRAIIKLVDES